MNRLKDCRDRYDALDLLVGIEPPGGETRQRFYARELLVTELQGQSSQNVFQHGKQLLALQSRQGDVVKSGLLAIDQQRSVLQVTEPVGAVRQAYTPYGHRCAESGLGSLLGFAGEALDPFTGHYLLGNGHRAFNPVLMRFNSPDSLSPYGRGGLNPYAYCLGDPVNFSDPSGRFVGIARLITAGLSVISAKIVFSAAIPYKVGKNALQWGAAGQLPFKYTLGAAGSTVAGVSTMLSALTAVASAVAGITGDSDAAKNLGFIALGLGALTVTGRLGSRWAASDPKTIPALRDFADNKGRVIVPAKTYEPSAPPPSMPSSPDPFTNATAPPLTVSPTNATRFTFPENNRATGFLSQQIDRQVRLAQQKTFRRYSEGVIAVNDIRRRPSR